MGLVILLTKLADGMESPSASLAIVGGYGKGKVCILDSGGYVYHGRVAAVAEGAREGGLEF